jgi:hypothetical protein
VFDHVGLLFTELPGNAELLFILFSGGSTLALGGAKAKLSTTP